MRVHCGRHKEEGICPTWSFKWWGIGRDSDKLCLYDTALECKEQNGIKGLALSRIIELRLHVAT